MIGLRLPSLVLAALVVANVPTASRAEIAPAFDQLYRTGISAAQREDWESAVKYLRLAVFGFVDEPARVAAGLAHLALAEAHVPEEASALQSTLERILYVEERFRGYRDADLTPAIRERFEELLARKVPPESFLQLDAFREAARRSALAEIDVLPLDEAVARLDEMAQAEPRSRLWPREAARRLLAAEKYPEAAARLAPRARAGQLAPEETCLLAQALAAASRCDQAAPHLPSCTELPRDRALAAALLECELESGSLSRASSHLASLGEARRQKPFRRIDRELEGRREELAEENRRAQSSPGSSEPAADTTVAPEAASVPASVEVDLGPIRELVGQRSRKSLQAAQGMLDELHASGVDTPAAHALSGEIAYLLREWPRAVRHFDQAQVEEVELRFYFAVALFEAGQEERAAEVLRSCLPDLRETPFVARYRQKILGAG